MQDVRESEMRVISVPPTPEDGTVTRRHVIPTPHSRTASQGFPNSFEPRLAKAATTTTPATDSTAASGSAWRQTMKAFRSTVNALNHPKVGDNDSVHTPTTIDEMILARHSGSGFFQRMRLRHYYKTQMNTVERYMEHDKLQRQAAQADGLSGMLGMSDTDDDDDNQRLISKDGANEPANGDMMTASGHFPAGRPGVQISDEEEEEGALAYLAARGSLILNICLLGLKIYAAYATGSLTVIASVMDSALDLFSGIVIVIVGWLTVNSESSSFPTGKHRFESIGTLIFSCAMCVAATKLIEESATKMADISSVEVKLGVVVFAVLGFVIVSKFIAFILCRRCSENSSMVQALAMDHRNDVISNSVGVAAIFGAAYHSPWWDPVVALATTLFIMYTWGSNAFEQAIALSGKAADTEYLNCITLLARNHDPRIIGVDTVRAVTSGQGYIVEVDLVLPAGMPLQEAHDIGERFQIFLESTRDLEVSRAYVHLDYETDHNPREHR